MVVLHCVIRYDLCVASPLTLRLDEPTRRRIARIARRKGLSTSEFVRLAIAAWASQHEPVAEPFAAVADLVGIVRGGNTRRSQQTGRKLAALLKKNRARRPAR
jgi:hypothetical protein